MEWSLSVIQGLLLLVGCVFLVIGGIGILRLPDVFTRLHAAGLTDTMGAGLVLLGLAIQGGFSLVTAKIVLILIFLWLTSPVSSHALAKIALEGGYRPLLAKDERETPPSSS